MQLTIEQLLSDRSKLEKVFVLLAKLPFDLEEKGAKTGNKAYSEAAKEIRKIYQELP